MSGLFTRAFETTTGMPALAAFLICGALPLKSTGLRTMPSNFCVIIVAIWLFCTIGSYRPSKMVTSTVPSLTAGCFLSAAAQRLANSAFSP